MAEGEPAGGEPAEEDAVQEEDPWEILTTEFGEAPEGETAGESPEGETADPAQGPEPAGVADPRPARGDKS
jgi:hypothetical protein